VKEPIPSPFNIKPDGDFFQEIYALVEKYGFHQCAVFVSHKVDNDSDEWTAQSNCVSDGMVEHIEHILKDMRGHLEEYGPDEA
jgi:hypothetical protein